MWVGHNGHVGCSEKLAEARAEFRGSRGSEQLKGEAVETLRRSCRWRPRHSALESAWTVSELGLLQSPAETYLPSTYVRSAVPNSRDPAPDAGGDVMNVHRLTTLPYS